MSDEYLEEETGPNEIDIESEQGGDIDVSQHVVNLEQGDNADEDFKTKLKEKRIEYLVPELQELLIPSDDPEKPFNCKSCNASFRNQVKFQRHVISHTGKEIIKMPYKCPECERTCKTLADCLRHKLCHKYKQEIMYKCNYKKCKKSFTGTQKRIFVSHVQMHQGKKKFECKECGGGFKSERSLAIHRSSHNPNMETYTCQYCEKTFSHETYLKFHERNVHINAGKFKCDVCSYTASKLMWLERHRETHDIKGPYICETCDRVFTYKYVLYKHTRANNCKPPDSPKPAAHVDDSGATKWLDSRVVAMMGRARSIKMPFRCKHCSLREFKTAFVFTRHLKNSHFDLYPEIDTLLKKAYKCDQCDKCFESLTTVKHHQLMHSNLNPYKCDYPGCSKECKTKEILYEHERIHKERKHVCSKCGSRFISRSKLQSHDNSVHLNIRPHKCSYCSRGFRDKLKRQEHVDRMHLKLKKAMCDTCGRSFATMADLKVHSKKHTGEKRYKCDKCDYRSLRSDYLKKHKRTHTGEKPYQCEKCGMAFIDRTPLVTHMRKHHGSFQIEQLAGKGSSTLNELDSTNESESAVVVLQAGMLLQSLQNLSDDSAL